MVAAGVSPAFPQVYVILYVPCRVKSTLSTGTSVGLGEFLVALVMKVVLLRIVVTVVPPENVQVLKLLNIIM
jgi:hypothetical protein